MEEAGLEYKELNFVAVSSGPGSYTGLRIGVSTAKGICFAMNIPLVSVDSFESMYMAAKEKGLAKGKNVTAMIDARRMEVYTVSWDMEGNRVSKPEALILDETHVEKYMRNQNIFIGNGASKLRTLQGGEELNIYEDIFPDASYMVEKALHKYQCLELEDIAYFEPFYLKSFYITKAKNPLDNGK
jgi:tRNA threonylcarbamoyladenosine biosynthesis protein TsaB